MKFGGLSEKEMDGISKILESEGITFSVDKDSEIEQFNSNSMKNDLRHYTPPNISTHILAVTIADEDFAKISEKSKARLLGYGITDQAPSPEEFVSATGESIHKELLKGPNRMIGVNFKHQLIVGAVVLIAYLFYEYY